MVQSNVIHFAPNFDVGAPTYDQVAWAQRQSADMLLQLLISHSSDLSANTILDVGTGTGYLINKLHQYFPGSMYTANDVSPLMLDRAKDNLRHINNINYHLGDAEQTDFPHYNLVISNFAFQWFKNLEYSLSKLWQHSTTLAFATLLDGTFEQWWQLCDAYNVRASKPQYPSYNALHDYCQALKPSKARFALESIPVVAESPIVFMRYIKQLGARIGTGDCCSGFMSLSRCYKQAINTQYHVFFAVLEK